MPGSKASSQSKTWAGRYIRNGASFGVSMPPELRQKMGFIVGDYVLFLLVGDVLRMRKVTPTMILEGEFFAEPHAAPKEGGA